MHIGNIKGSFLLHCIIVIGNGVWLCWPFPVQSYRSSYRHRLGRPCELVGRLWHGTTAVSSGDVVALRKSNLGKSVKLKSKHGESVRSQTRLESFGFGASVCSKYDGPGDYSCVWNYLESISRLC